MKYLLLIVVLGLALWFWRSYAGGKEGDGRLPSVGDAAPGFELPDTRGVKHTLTQYRGHWVVLYFYPKADTPGCTRESCRFRDDWPRPVISEAAGFSGTTRRIGFRVKVEHHPVPTVLGQRVFDTPRIGQLKTRCRIPHAGQAAITFFTARIGTPKPQGQTKHHNQQ